MTFATTPDCRLVAGLHRGPGAEGNGAIQVDLKWGNSAGGNWALDWHRQANWKKRRENLRWRKKARKICGSNHGQGGGTNDAGDGAADSAWRIWGFFSSWRRQLPQSRKQKKEINVPLREEPSTIMLIINCNLGYRVGTKRWQLTAVI